MVASSEQQYCTFRVGGHRFGIDVTRVLEVIRDQETTRVPCAPREVRGLINLRGQIVTAIDLRRRLKMADRGPDEAPVNVLVASPGGVVSLQADQIDDVVDIDPLALESAPESLDDELRSCIKAVCKLDYGLLLLLDESRAMELRS